MSGRWAGVALKGFGEEECCAGDAMADAFECIGEEDLPVLCALLAGDFGRLLDSDLLASDLDLGRPRLSRMGMTSSSGVSGGLGRSACPFASTTVGFLAVQRMAG